MRRTHCRIRRPNDNVRICAYSDSTDPTHVIFVGRPVDLLNRPSAVSYTCPNPPVPATVSHHLKTLADAGLIECRREGQFTYNRALSATMEDYVGSLSRMIRSKKTRPADHKEDRQPSTSVIHRLGISYTFAYLRQIL